MATTLASTDALATVEKETFTTLGHPADMTDDELADVVVRMFGKIREMLPYIVALKERFDMGERDSLNRLKTPIKGCSSWKDFCTSILNRAPQTIGEAMRPAKVKNLGSRLTGVDVAEYEREHRIHWTRHHPTRLFCEETENDKKN